MSKAKRFIQAAYFISVFAYSGFSQTPPPDAPIRIPTEEVHLNVTAQTAGGKFVPNLQADDLLVVEDGAPQEITSVRRAPASVLVLLDTGGDLNFAKSLAQTRLTAKLLVEKIAPGNSIAVMQAYNKIETVSDWTENRAAAQTDLDRKLFGGRRSSFVAAISAAVEKFKTRPPENRHLVFIGDGLDSLASADERRAALEKLLAANVSFHVIAYNKMEAARAKPMTRRIQIGEEREARRMPDHVLEDIISNLPPDMRDGFRKIAKSERLFIIRLDGKALKIAKQKLEEWQKNEAELQAVAEDTGGIFQAPEEPATMWRLATEIAGAIGSQYVVTYSPKRAIGDSPVGETRKVRVGTHCDGVHIRARHKIIAAPPEKAQK
jgi:VWFA-related protein